MRTPVWMLAIGAGLVALLVLVAVLQYRWVGQVSDAERQRLHASAVTSADRFAADFDGELTRLFLAVQADHAGQTSVDGAALAGAEARWRATTAFSAMLGDTYVLHLDGAPALQKLDGDHLTPSAWPAALAPLRTALAADAAQTSDRTPLFVRALNIQSAIPALVVPIVPPTLVIRRDASPPPKPLPGSGPARRSCRRSPS
jgi:hypothetical protein